MTEILPPYFADRVILDPCTQGAALPACPDFSVSADGISEDYRRLVKKAIESMFLDVAHHLSTSPEAWAWEGRRTVRLWDLLEFSVALDGTDLQLRHTREDPDMSRCLVRADLSQPIGRFAWPSAMEALIAPALRRAGLNPKVLPGPTGMYIRRILIRSFRNYVDWQRLRRSILRFLDLDPLVVSLTRRTFEGGMARLESFNWVARNIRELALVAAEHPRLLPFLQIVCGEEGSPIQNFERAMEEAGMRPTARRKLERWGFDSFSMATEYGLLADSRTVMADFANLLDRLCINEEPHIMLAELAVRGVGTTAPEWYLRALWKEIQALAEDEPDDAYPADFELTAAWIAFGPPEPDDNQKQAGWPWIVEQAWKHRIATDEGARLPWAVPCADLSIDGHDVLAIRTVVDLREEADAMHNCLTSLEGDCRVGKIVLFSIRKGGRRLASFTLKRVGAGRPSWEMVEIAGKLNRTAPDEMRGVAIQTAQILNKDPRS